jgi:FkbH-like protein
VDFHDLRRNAKKPATGHRPVRAALVGDCSTQHLAQALVGWAWEAHIALDLYDAPYDQISQQLRDPGSAVHGHRPSFILVMQSTEKLWDQYAASKPETRAEFANTFLANFEESVVHAMRQNGARLVASNFPVGTDRTWGNHANKQPSSFTYQLRRINLGLMELASRTPDLHIADAAALATQHGLASSVDAKMRVLASMAYSLDFLVPMAEAYIRIIESAIGATKKCLVLDLDNTLWGGVVGDDGVDRIQIGGLGAGRAFTQIQRWAKLLQQRGVVLAICSKNDEGNAKDPFLRHPDMVLRLDDISVFVANWEDKASNIRDIQRILNIGFDSMVFVDDSPFERNIVRGFLPEVTVPELPDDPALYVDYLNSLALFECASSSALDRERTAHYQAEASRVEAKQTFTAEGEYLASLQMIARAIPVDAFATPRVAQLTQRSNQFNLRTVRYSESDIAGLAADSRTSVLGFSLADRFGDYGLVGVVILVETVAHTLFVDSWIMSCRVLSRGMEEFMCNKIVEQARDRGHLRIVGEYIPTAKNGMVSDLYTRMGFLPEGSRFTLTVDSYQPMETLIKDYADSSAQQKTHSNASHY